MNHSDLFELVRLRVAASSLKEYDRILNYFTKWLKQNKLNPKIKSKEIDLLVTRFSFENYEKGPLVHGLSTATKVKLCLEHYFPEIKENITITYLRLPG